MNLFGIQFFICNIYIAIFIIFLMLVKRIFKKYLSHRIQYNLWFILFLLFVIPFLQFPVHHFSLFYHVLNINTVNHVQQFQNVFTNNQNMIMSQINDMTVSINNQTMFIINNCIIYIWLIGIIVMSLLTIKSYYRMFLLKKTALPLQNQKVYEIYQSCLSKMNIKKEIPIYSTAFLETPILTGFIKPRIYIPIHLISDLNEQDMQYILLHELYHYVYKDTLINIFMTIFRIIYWFNCMIWYAFNMMKLEREIACDISTLNILKEDEYIQYGYALLHFAKKRSLSSFPYINEIGGSSQQIKKRIISISQYQKETLKKKISSIIIYFMTFTISWNFIPILSTYAQEKDDYMSFPDNMEISYIDYSSLFDQYEGSFVLYDQSHNIWKIYNEQYATLRVSPNSTYKIYDALLALEAGIISPQNSYMKWDHTHYPFQEWESHQSLNSAMAYSVNWYFQSLDAKLGMEKIQSFLSNIQYGNQTMSHDLETYWTDSSLKISPIEQVQLLQQFHQNTFSFSNENVQTVKDAIMLASGQYGSLYGKTGTGRVNDRDINGWFIGFIEAQDNTYYFATNIQSDSNAKGSQATEITLSILEDLDIWK